MNENKSSNLDSDESLRKVGLERVNGVLLPSDRAQEERELLERHEKFKEEYGNPDGVAKLGEQVRAEQAALDAWKAQNPLANEYLTAIQTWQLGWGTPMFKEDEVNAKNAEVRMRAIEGEMNINPADKSLSANELAAKGYSDLQIQFFHELIVGKDLMANVLVAQKDLNRATSLLGGN